MEKKEIKKVEQKKPNNKKMKKRNKMKKIDKEFIIKFSEI